MFLAGSKQTAHLKASLPTFKVCFTFIVYYCKIVKSGCSSSMAQSFQSSKPVLSLDVPQCVYSDGLAFSGGATTLSKERVAEASASLSLQHTGSSSTPGTASKGLTSRPSENAWSHSTCWTNTSVVR